MEGITYQLDVVGPDGEVLRTHGGRPGAEWLTSWPANSLVRESTGLYFYPETAAGRYRLRWQLFEHGQVVGGRTFYRPWMTETVFNGSIEVLPWPMNRDLPEDVTLVDAQFGSSITLYGYDLPDVDGDIQPLTLYWVVRETPTENYLIFIHLVDRASGQLISQVDTIPVGSLRPTEGWRKGEVLADNYALTLPADIPSGIYDIRVGIYNPDNGLRLPVKRNDRQQADDQLALEPITIP
jgi:hypothetical protein